MIQLGWAGWLAIAMAAVTEAGPPMTVRGRVVGPDGRPVAGAEVFLAVRDSADSAPSAATITEVDGEFSLRGSASFEDAARDEDANRAVVAHATGFGVGWVRLPAEPRVPAEVRLAEDGPPIEGQILDQAGGPVAGASVVARRVIVPVVQPGESATAALARHLGHPLNNPAVWTDQGVPIRRETTTDASGSFALAGIGPDRVALLEVAGPTIAQTWAAAITRDGVAPILAVPNQVRFRPWHQPRVFVLTAPPTRIVAGVVRDRATGRPLGRIDVTASCAGGGSLASVGGTTDATGRFRLAGLPIANRHAVCFRPAAGQPYLAVQVDHEAGPGRGEVAINQDLEPAALVRGRVADAMLGRPVRGSVQALPCPGEPERPAFPGFDAGNSLPQTTDDEGRFVLAVPPGRSLVAFNARDASRYRPGQGGERVPRYDPEERRLPATAHHASYRVATRDVLEVIDVPAGGVAPVDLAVDPDGTIELALIDPAGDPLVGAEVLGADPAAPAQLLPTRHWPRVLLRGFEAASRPRPVAAWHRRRRLAGSALVGPVDGLKATLQLLPWAEVSGRAVRPDGTPCRLARVDLKGAGEGPVAFLHDAITPAGPATNEDGRFVIVGVIPGLACRPAVAASTGEPDGEADRDFIFTPGEVRDLGDVTVSPRPIVAPRR